MNPQDGERLAHPPTSASASCVWLVGEAAGMSRKWFLKSVLLKLSPEEGGGFSVRGKWGTAHARTRGLVTWLRGGNRTRVGLCAEWNICSQLGPDGSQRDARS